MAVRNRLQESLGKVETSGVFLQKMTLVMLVLPKSRWGGADPVALPGACEGRAEPQQSRLLLSNNTPVIERLGK